MAAGGGRQCDGYRIDVTGKSERAIDRVEIGVAINLNHDQYYLKVETYEAEQPLKP